MAATITERWSVCGLLVLLWLTAAAHLPAFVESQLVLVALFALYARMERQAEDLLAAVKDSNVSSEVKIQQFTDLKTHIKHHHVPEAAISPSFESIRVGINSHPLQDTAFSTLKHLSKRLMIQEQHDIIAIQGAKTYHLIVDHLGDSRDRVRTRASQALTDFWIVTPADVEEVIRDVVLSAKLPRAKVAGLQWISKVNQEQGLQFRSFVPKIVDCLEDTDGTVREAAKVTVIELFQNAPDRAKSDLKKNLHRRNVRETIVSHLLSQLGLASTPEVDLKTSTQSHVGDPPKKEEPLASSVNGKRPAPCSGVNCKRHPSHSAGVKDKRPGAPLPSFGVNDKRPGAPSPPSGANDKRPDAPLPPSGVNDKRPRASSNSSSVNDKRPAAHSPSSIVNDKLPAAPSPSSTAEDAEQLEPIYLNTYRELDDIVREMTPYFEGKESEQNWTHREKSVVKLRKITKGNAPSDFTTTYLAGVKGLLDGILKTANSLRTTVSTNGCHLVQDIAKAAGPGLDPMVEILLQSLIKLCGGTKKISAQNGNVTVNGIFANVTFNLRLLQHIWNACQDKNVQPRIFATEWLKTVITKHGHHKHVLEHAGGLELIEKCIKKGLTDANPGVRTSMRPTYWAFWRVWPERSDFIMSALDGKQQDQLLKDPTNPNPSNGPVSSNATTGKVAPIPRSTASRPSLKETIAAQKRAKIVEKDSVEHLGSGQVSFTPTKSHIPSVSIRPGTAMATASRKTSTATTSTTQTGSLSSAPVRPTKPRRSSLPRPVTADPPASQKPKKMENPSVSVNTSSAKDKPRNPARAVSNARSKVATKKAESPATNTGKLKHRRAKSDDQTTKSVTAIASLKVLATNNSSFTKSTEDMPNPMSPTAILGVNGHMSSSRQEDFPTSMSPKAILDVNGCMPSNTQGDMPSLRIPTAIIRANGSMLSVKQAGAKKSMSPRDPYSKKENMAFSRVKDLGPRSTGPMKVYEDPVTETEIQITSRPDTKVTVLEELPLNDSTNSQNTRFGSPSYAPVDETSPPNWKGAAVLKESRKRSDDLTYEPKMARRMIESGIVLMRAGKMDMVGLRKLQGIICANADIWDDSTTFDGTLIALLDYLEPAIREPEAKYTSRDFLCLKMQILSAIRMMLGRHRETFAIYDSLALCRLLSARKHHMSGSHVAITLEETAGHIMLTCDPHMCIDGVLDLLEFENTDEKGNRTRVLGMYVLAGLLQRVTTRKENIVDLAESELSRLWNVVVVGLRDCCAAIRKHTIEYTVVLHDFIGQKMFWKMEDSSSLMDKRNLVTYYLERRET